MKSSLYFLPESSLWCHCPALSQWGPELQRSDKTLMAFTLAYSLFLLDGCLCANIMEPWVSPFSPLPTMSPSLVHQAHQLALFGLLFSWSFLVSISLQEAHHLIITPRCHLPKDGRQVCRVSHPAGIPRWPIILNTLMDSLSLLSNYGWFWVPIRPSYSWYKSDFPRNNLAYN